MLPDRVSNPGERERGPGMMVDMCLFGYNE